MHVVDRRSEDRATKGVLWRAPLSLQKRIRESASVNRLSQNAYLTTAAIFGELIVFRKADGKPQNAIRLIRNMNKVVSDEASENIVMDFCHERDWRDVSEIIYMLQDANIIAAVRDEERPDVPQMKMYAFSFTREGAEVWAKIGPRLELLLECSGPMATLR